MSRPRRIRKVIFSTLWLVIGAVTAVSLAALAFSGGNRGPQGDELTPTGSAESEVITVERTSIKNVLTVDVAINLNPPTPVKSVESGELVYRAVRDGEQVTEGARVFQIKVPVIAAAPEQPPEQTTDGSAESSTVPLPEPRYRYVDVTAPAAGQVRYAAELGAALEKGQVVAQIAPGTFAAKGQIEPADRYRLQNAPKEAEITIARGPKPFMCTNLRTADAATEKSPGTTGDSGSAGENPESDGGQESTRGNEITCDIPAEVTVFDGLAGTMKIDIGTTADAIAVPVSAVRGLVNTGTVWLANAAGEPTPREVELGATNGALVEVRSGLAEGDEVLRYVPGTQSEDADGSAGEDGTIEGPG